MSGVEIAAAESVAEDQGAVGVTVEITPRDTQCTVGCGGDSPGIPSAPLPMTGSEPASIALAVALLVAGGIAVAVARRRPRIAREE